MLRLLLMSWPRMILIYYQRHFTQERCFNPLKNQSKTSDRLDWFFTSAIVYNLFIFSIELV
ncbi:hypothetical protein GCM10011573_15720 [Enterococcus wangshanyuanii]|uniref:Transposase n=1 Tax=Enterococcus wangshanyuanii TaxID=2005703 RepID=A0ABQ1NX89_9ENTE|nr:hypothetical protein GCM10011573_15720 [Enterococcus wangshanyuanii]